jgi:uncharacterized protein YbcI
VASREAITNEIVRLYADRFGRGPTRARTYLMDDLVVCVLGDLTTPLEQTLEDAGRTDLVEQVRREVRELLSPSLRAVIERHTGCSTIAMLGDIDPRSDTAALVFLLD